MTRQYITTLKTNMAKEDVSLDFLLQIINGTKNCILQELNHNELVTEKHKKSVKDFKLL